MSPNSRSHEILMYVMRYHIIFHFLSDNVALQPRTKEIVNVARRAVDVSDFRVTTLLCNLARREKCVSAQKAGARSSIFRVQSYGEKSTPAIPKNYDFIQVREYVLTIAPQLLCTRGVHWAISLLGLQPAFATLIFYPFISNSNP